MPMPSPVLPGRWRVNIDVQHGAVTADPELSPGQLIAEVVDDGVPTAVIDLDRSTGHSSSTTLLETAVRHHPDRLWAGGRLSPRAPAVARLLEAGAAGVLLGSTGLFPDGHLHPDTWPDFADLAPASRLMLSVDALDGNVVTDGFTRPSTLPLTDALDALINATGGAHPVLVTDAGAATRRTPPPWGTLDHLAARFPRADLWYAGGLTNWPDLHRLWRAGWGAVVGRAYLTAPRGLTDADGRHHRTPPADRHRHRPVEEDVTGRNFS